MKNVAFTIGQTINYDKVLLERPNDVKKVGKYGPTENEPIGYEGGCVWRRAKDAYNYLNNHFKEMFPNGNSQDFSVYSIQLPNGWEIDTKENDNKLYHNLLNDALILGKYKKSNKQISVIEKNCLGATKCANYLVDLLNDLTLISQYDRHRLLTAYGKFDRNTANIHGDFHYSILNSKRIDLNFIEKYYFQAINIELNKATEIANSYSHMNPKIISLYKNLIFELARVRKEHLTKCTKYAILQRNIKGDIK